jgi:hypothetical protein
MKIGIRKLYYAAGGGAEYQERVEVWHCYYSGKHGRYKKDKNLSRRVRHMTKRVYYDNIDETKNIN